VSLPLGIYDNPRLGAAPFTGEMYRVLADEANVRLSKDSSGDITRVLEVSLLCKDKVAILHGEHMQMLAAYLYGAVGVCTAMAAVFPQVCLDLYRLCTVEQRWEEARGVFTATEPIFRFFQRHSLARCVKEASELMGRPLGPQRAPLSGLSSDERQAIRELLERHSLLPAHT
jgi:4-hydroxy-tetrahydrodipicolinate synthase